ncbi:MAG: NifB/NifX family molybdenum-iron cluster-binding protein [Bacteroidota bacterium]
MTMRIAFGTDDNITLKQERFGDSRQFRIVTIDNDTVTTTELRNNPFADPAIENKPPKILSLLNDCDVFVGRSWRTGSFTLFTESGKTVFLSHEEDLDAIISSILSHDFSSLKKFDSREQKFISA